MNLLNGKVLITGGAGFLARGIMRRAAQQGWGCDFTVYSRDEQKQMAARKKYPARYVIGDINDPERLEHVMSGHDIVIHTAALKYIPEGESNPWECVRVNVDGSRAVMMAAMRAEVRQVVMISTDKAAHPINTYGMTKALMERMVHEAATWESETSIVACRYGNVIGSTGSIWPVFKRQLADDGCVSVTQRSMTRFFFSIDEAVDLILASIDAPSGNVVIPAPRAAKVGDIASAIVEANGYDPALAIKFVGPRPGEKHDEDMIGPNEAQRMAPLDEAECSKYFRLAPPWDAFGGRNLPVDFEKYMNSKNPLGGEMSGVEFVALAQDSEAV